MRITPALAYEKLRQDAESQNKIILHKDGKFYHVYEWSAWLLKTLVCTEELQRERGDASASNMNLHHPNEVWASTNSFLGVLSHYSSFNIRSRMFLNKELLTLGKFNRDMTQFTLRQ